MNALWQDLRFIARTGWTPSNRSTTLVVILTLALGIGATVSIFSVVEGVLLRPLAVREPARLVYVQLTTAEARASTIYGRIANWDLYAAWRAESAVFEELAAYSMTMPVLTEMGPARRIPAVAASSNAFGFLGATPKLGRTFAPDEEVPGVAPAVILSHSFWASNFGSDPEVLGGSLTLDGRRFEIVGVMPSRFRIPFSIPEVRQAEAEVWIPMGAYLPAQRSPQAAPPGVNVMGRLQGGVTPQDAQVRLDRSLSEGVLAAGASATVSHVTHVVPLRRVIVGQVRTPLLMLMAAAVLVLLIACGNVVNLLLARALLRQREVSLRLALGAARERIFRQFLTEAVVLAVVGGGIGVLLAWYGTPLLLQLAQNRLPHTGDIGINATVLGAALCVSVLTGVATGLVPALRAMRSVSFAGLREARPRAGTSAWSSRASDVLVVVEIALTMILVSSMVLLTRSFRNLADFDRGYQVENVLAAALFLPGERYSSSREQRAFAEGVLERTRAIPGVVDAAVSTGAPTLGGPGSTMRVPGSGDSGADIRGMTWEITADYFETLGIRILRGRSLTPGDGPDAVVVDESAVRELFGEQDPIGQRVAWHDGARVGTVVGVVGDVSEFYVDTRDNTNYRSTEPHIYARLGEEVGRSIRILARTQSDPAAMASLLRRAVAEVDSDVPISSLDSMENLVNLRFARERFVMALMLTLAAIALLIAATGIYAVVSYATARRTYEFGVRMALGAQKSAIVGLAIRRGLALATAGILAGLFASMAATQLVRGLLYGVSPSDPMIWIVVAGIVAGVALLATLVPSLNAVRVDPVIALRDS